MRYFEQFVKQRIEPMKAPTRCMWRPGASPDSRERILQTLAEEELDLYLNLVEELAELAGRDISEIAAAAARLAEDKPLVVDLEPEPEAVAHLERAWRATLSRLAGAMGCAPADIVGAIANERRARAGHRRD